MLIFEFFKAAFKLHTFLNAMPLQNSFGPIFTKSFRLLDSGHKDRVNSYAQQKERKAADKHIKQKKNPGMFFKEIHADYI
jgi:hypothetical protein